MNTWTPTARRTLHQYLKRSRIDIARTGADPDEVAADLQRHVEEEISALRLPVVTESDVQQIVRRLGPFPHDENDTEPKPVPQPPIRTKNLPHLKGFNGWFLLFLAVILPTITLGVELATHMCAGVFFDPLPTWGHVALSVLVPIANGLAWMALRQGISPLPKWLWIGNGVSLGVTLYYSILFLPITPFAFIGILYFGFGLLPLTPLLTLLCAFELRSLLRRAFAESGASPRGWLGAMAGSFAVLCLVTLPEPLTNHWIDQAASDSPEVSAKAVQSLRKWGSQDVLLKAAYGKRNPPFFFLGGVLTSTETAQNIFYRVTGKPYNAFPPPVSKYQESGRGLFDEFDWDSGLGGEQVAGRIRKLSMTQSRVDGLCNPNEGWAYLEWIMEFKNDHPSSQREARAQILLPPGGVVSRLTLWVNGEEREAAFAGRGQVREAYQKVAVQQRRDPVLVTTSGPDRVLMQCFPIPPNGGTMKVRLGITIPLIVENAHQAALKLPCFIEHNFGMTDSFQHHLWLESAQKPLASAAGFKSGLENSGRFSVNGDISDAQLTHTETVIRFPLAADATSVRVKDRHSKTGAIVRQTLERIDTTKPGRIAVVIDGSQGIENSISEIADAVAVLPRDIPVTVWSAKDSPEKLFDGESADRDQIASSIRRLRVEGGQDNVPALLAAWDWVRSKPAGVILWIHESQPISISSAELLKQKFDWRTGGATGPALVDVPVRVAPNRLIEQFDGFEGLTSLPRLGALKEDIARLADAWTGENPTYQFSRTTENSVNAGIPSTFTEASFHVVRLWALEKIRFLIKARQTKEAVSMAGLYQLVTPVSGAVVLETMQQFQEAGLTPVDAASVPVVPEPGTWALLCIGVLILLLKSRVKNFASKRTTVANR